MQVNFFRFEPAFKSKEYTPKRYSNLSPLMCDTISFGALKKNQFSGVDLLVVNKFKAPIEKFNSNEDFQNWCAEKIKEIEESELTGRKEETETNRKKLLAEWQNTIKKNNYSNAEALLILDGITKNLKKNNDALPPPASSKALKSAMGKVKKRATCEVSFQKTYLDEIKNSYNVDNEGWIVIPGKKSSPDDFEENVKKLKVFSCKTWCTNGEKARSDLKEGDAHLFIENGKTKLGIVLKGNEISEIQGELNNWMLPFEYLEEVKRHIKECGLKTTKKSQAEIDNTEKAKYILEEQKIILKDAIENNNAKEIFEHFGIETKENEDGFLTISEYRKPSPDFTFSDLGIDENKLLEKVVSIEGDARFFDSNATNLGSVRNIKGNADFEYSNIKTLGNLETIGKSANFIYSNTRDLGNLKSIGENATFGGSLITSLNNLEFIGKNADFRGSKITDFGKLKEIGLNVFVPKNIPDEQYDFLAKIAECGIYYY